MVKNTFLCFFLVQEVSKDFGRLFTRPCKKRDFYYIQSDELNSLNNQRTRTRQ